MYLILLTGKNSSADIVAGLRAGADDYVAKPFNLEELQARVKVGENVLSLQMALATQLAAATEALAGEQRLRELLLNVPCRQGEAGQDLRGPDWNGIEPHLSQTVKPQGTECERCRPRVEYAPLELTTGSRKTPRV